MQRPPKTSSILPPNYKENTLIQIGWNGFWRKQCEVSPIKLKECPLILSLVYDPHLKRLVPADISSK